MFSGGVQRMHEGHEHGSGHSDEVAALVGLLLCFCVWMDDANGDTAAYAAATASRAGDVRRRYQPDTLSRAVRIESMSIDWI